MSSSGMRGSPQKPQPEFAEWLLENYVNGELLGAGEMNNFEHFKLNFGETWIPAEDHNVKIKSDLFRQHQHQAHQLEGLTVSLRLVSKLPSAKGSG